MSTPFKMVVNLEPFGDLRLGGVSQVVATTGLGDKRGVESVPLNAINFLGKEMPCLRL